MRFLAFLLAVVLIAVYLVTFSGCGKHKQKHKHQKEKLSKNLISSVNEPASQKNEQKRLADSYPDNAVESCTCDKTTQTDTTPIPDGREKKIKKLEIARKKKIKKLKLFLAECEKKLKKYKDKLQRCKSKLTPLYSQKKMLEQQYKNAIEAVHNAKRAYLAAKKEAKKKHRYWYVIKAGIRRNKNLHPGKAPRGMRNVRYVYLKDSNAVARCEQCKLNYKNRKKAAANLKKQLSDCKSKIHNIELCALNYKKEIKQIKLDIKRTSRKLELMANKGGDKNAQDSNRR